MGRLKAVEQKESTAKAEAEIDRKRRKEKTRSPGLSSAISKKLPEVPSGTADAQDFFPYHAVRETARKKSADFRGTEQIRISRRKIPAEDPGKNAGHSVVFTVVL